MRMPPKLLDVVVDGQGQVQDQDQDQAYHHQHYHRPQIASPDALHMLLCDERMEEDDNVGVDCMRMANDHIQPSSHAVPSDAVALASAAGTSTATATASPFAFPGLHERGREMRVVPNRAKRSMPRWMVGAGGGAGGGVGGVGEGGYPHHGYFSGKPPGSERTAYDDDLLAADTLFWLGKTDHGTRPLTRQDSWIGAFYPKKQQQQR